MISCKAKPKATVTAERIPTAPEISIPNKAITAKAKQVYKIIFKVSMKKFFADKSALMPFLMPLILFKTAMNNLINKFHKTIARMAKIIR